MMPSLTVMLAAYVANIEPITDPHLANLVFRMHGDGTEGSTSITDVKGKTITLNGSPYISRANLHWGLGAVRFPASTDDLTVQQSTDFAMGTGDFTIEGWCFSTNYANTQGVFQLCGTAHWTGSVSNAIALAFKSSGVAIYANNAETNSGAFTLPTNSTWAHFSVCRASGTTRVFINGVKRIEIADSRNYTGEFFGLNGIWTQAPGLGTPGYLQEVSVYKGIAKYTADFTPPSGPYLDA